MFAVRAGARSARVARVPRVQARGMAGHGHESAQQYTGIEKVVRGYLKKDEHVSGRGCCSQLPIFAILAVLLQSILVMSKAGK